jgi:hypothetical protein
MSERLGIYVLEKQGLAGPGQLSERYRPNAIMSVHGLSEPPGLAGQILAGQARGRVVIEIGR